MLQYARAAEANVGKNPATDICCRCGVAAGTGCASNPHSPWDSRMSSSEVCVRITRADRIRWHIILINVSGHDRDMRVGEALTMASASSEEDSRVMAM